MAEDSSQEKSEEPTSKKLEKAREDGQVPRSKELNTSVVLVVGAGALIYFGAHIREGMQLIATESFNITRDQIMDTGFMLIYLRFAIYEVLSFIAPFFAVMLLAAFAGPVGIGGWNFSTKAFMPKGDRISPLAGIKRMFSANSAMEFVKAILKVVLIGSLAFFILQRVLLMLIDISRTELRVAMVESIVVFGWSFFALAAITIIIAAIDIPFQIHQNIQKLKMTMQEVKDELKNTEGKPEVKRKIRQLQQQMAQNRMMGEVPDADVVITNPSHYSVALKYDPETMTAPLIVAKGADLIAFKIREVADFHDVLILPAPPLARAMFHHGEVGEMVPPDLYVAVAQVLAYVFQLRQFHQGLGRKPAAPNKFDIPDDLDDQ